VRRKIASRTSKKRLLVSKEQNINISSTPQFTDIEIYISVKQNKAYASNCMVLYFLCKRWGKTPPHSIKEHLRKQE